MIHKNIKEKILWSKFSRGSLNRSLDATNLCYFDIL